MLHKSKFESASSILDYIWTGEADSCEDSYESVSESFEEISPLDWKTASAEFARRQLPFEHTLKSYTESKKVCCATAPIYSNECSICFEETDMMTVQGCGHQFCESCILNHIDCKVSEGINLRHQRTLVERPTAEENIWKLSQYIMIGVSCPHRGCSSLISEDILRKIMTSEDLLTAFEYVLLDQTVNQELAKELTRCPLACGNFLQEDCYCVNEDCRVIQMQKRKAEELKRFRRELFQGTHFLGWSVKVGSKFCPSCNFQIEKNGGCDHMYCIKCKTSFNWSEAKRVTLKGARGRK